MRHHFSLLIAYCGLALSHTAMASDDVRFKPLPVSNETPVAMESPKISSSDSAYKLKLSDFKVNATASQPDEIKDPFEFLNRKVYAFNDVIDRNLLRPIAVQYTDKVPEQVRDSYGQFRKNLQEPWNAINQLIQLKPKRAAKTLGRFTINTLTSLGFADPARRLGMVNESENFGVTLGYYNVPSGAFIMLPVFGPSTIRDSVGIAVDSQAQPQRYLLEDHETAYWTNNVISAVDARSQILDLDQLLEGDQYATLRDLYLQRQNFRIAEKKGSSAAQASFVEDVADVDGNEIDNAAPAVEQSTNP